LPTLWQAERPLVAFATFVDPRKRAYLFDMSGRDESFEGPSTGLMLHAYSIRHAIERGFAEYDFMRGNEPSNYSFAVRERRIRCVAVATRSGTNLGHRIDARSIAEVIEQAITLHRAGKTSEAERAYGQVLQVDRNNPDALHRLGQLLATKADYLAAMQLFKTLAGLKPELFKPWHYLAQCYEALGRDFDAANAYREVIRIRPEAFAGMARLLIRMGRIDDVNAALLNALSGALSLQNGPTHYSGKGRSRMQ
jgi:tetratricopeptide (TPR) repeat protein